LGLWSRRGKKCLLTGLEYILAKQQGCKFKINSAFYIPKAVEYKRIGETTIVTTLKPFYSIIQEIQAKRREHAKGDILNLLFKEKGNSMYGKIVRGMSNKRGFYTKTGKTFRLGDSD
jgi:hypothetical protein